MLNKIRESYHYGRYLKVKKLIDGSNELLDVGCGKPCESMEDGSFIKFIGHGIGMDIKDCSPGFAFKKGDVLKIPFPEKTFDVVVTMEVLEHVDNVDLALKDIHRVLKDGSVFIMSTPDNTSFWKFFWKLWTRTVGKMWEGKHKKN